MTKQGDVVTNGDGQMLGDQSFAEFMGQIINKGVDLGLLAVLYVSYDTLEVNIASNELVVILMEAVQFLLGRGLAGRFSIQSFEEGDRVVDLLTW